MIKSTDKKIIRYNINAFVKVKITEYGHKYLVGRHKELYEELSYTKPEEDSEGYSVWQLWVLMGTFGKCLETSKIMPSLPFETEIILLGTYRND